ncbi:SAM-dependent methyltransferase [Dehalobacter sp. MCB1]|nr:class I SAM-dependent methyltransferase [Dehalobacter sp. MCB1]RJE48488.1 SAM-dependent methyltransferase [Dehalobacter sp. MCB1]TCX50661.1 SAM-dependent methyltransferase [Dehalobacter sp. 14DCB1]TCX52429.1 SAM-dependent methyltransferase [Dehalobacter sp. 12DCB1]
MNGVFNPKGIGNTQTMLKMYLQQLIQHGDQVIDATAGRGKDTLFLAECVGPEGRVFAFDIQEEAIQSTRELLTAHKMLDRVALFRESHTEIGRLVPQGIRAVVFNLGYLPGSNQAMITEPETTLRAVNDTLKLLVAKGVIVCTVYRGHSHSLEEANALNAYAAELSKKDFHVLQGIYLNQGETSPYWLIIQKNRGDHL